MCRLLGLYATTIQTVRLKMSKYRVAKRHVGRRNPQGKLLAICTSWINSRYEWCRSATSIKRLSYVVTISDLDDKLNFSLQSPLRLFWKMSTTALSLRQTWTQTRTINSLSSKIDYKSRQLQEGWMWTAGRLTRTHLSSPKVKSFVNSE